MVSSRTWWKSMTLPAVLSRAFNRIVYPLQSSFLRTGPQNSVQQCSCTGDVSWLLFVSSWIIYFLSSLPIFNHTFYDYYYNETHLLYCFRVTSSRVNRVHMVLCPSLLCFFYSSVCSINIKIISHKAVKIWGMAAKNHD